MEDTGKLLRAYVPAFRERMLVDAEALSVPETATRAAADLPEDSRDLLDAMLLAAEAGDAVDPSFRQRIDAVGEPLWLAGLLLPRNRPTAGALIDPRLYAGAARTNRDLRQRRPFAERLPTVEATPSYPPSKSLWDAVVVAASLEQNPIKLNNDGQVRKDSRARLLESFGGDLVRWDSALRHAQATGLARAAGSQLYGFPEARPRRLVDPVAVLQGEQAEAGRVLLRAAGRRWIELDALLAVLAEYAPTLTQPHMVREAADVLHRTGALDASRDATGVVAVRRAQPGNRLPPGFMVMPDMDILVGCEELQLQDYGRLCRLAPYVSGDRAARHKLTREGVAADSTCGHTEPEAFLAEFSRTGVPLTVKQSLEQWARSAERITLLTGVTVLEEDGRLRVVDKAPPEARVIDYGTQHPPPAAFYMEEDTIVVPTGRDALNVRSAVARIADPIGRSNRGWLYRPNPRKTPDVRSLIESLRRLHIGQQLPGELEARLLAADGLDPVLVEEAVVVHLPEDAADALMRDRLAGQWLRTRVTSTQCLVHREDLPRLRARLAELGIEMGERT